MVLVCVGMKPDHEELHVLPHFLPRGAGLHAKDAMRRRPWKQHDLLNPVFERIAMLLEIPRAGRGRQPREDILHALWQRIASHLPHERRLRRKEDRRLERAVGRRIKHLEETSSVPGCWRCIRIRSRTHSHNHNQRCGPNPAG